MTDQNEKELMERQLKEREALVRERDVGTGIVEDKPAVNPVIGVKRERFEHPERSQQPDPSPTTTQQAEEVQRRANRQPHSERTVNGGKTLP